MPKCSFCGKMYDVPRGLTLVTKDGTIKHLCSSKCRKNMQMKRRKIRWISKKKKVKKFAKPEKVEKVVKKVEKPEKPAKK